ncbi:MAG: hypothetical protein LBQ48_07390 [Oscillospiraceae bacterium]|nr:hypothetical protein [Oscillospiraceae bacterium]
MQDIHSRSRWQVKVTGYYPVRAVSKSAKKPLPKSDYNPPKHEIDAFARCILPAIRAYFDTEAGRTEFAEWCEAQQAKSKSA